MVGVCIYNYSNVVPVWLFIVYMLYIFQFMFAIYLHSSHENNSNSSKRQYMVISNNK